MSARSRWVEIQDVLGTAKDGIPGKRDAAALEELRDAALAEYRAGQAPPVSGLTGPADERSEKNIGTLLPIVQPVARALVHAARKAGIEIKVISGTRSYYEQDELYAQGRTKPGKIVTKARGGYSSHNFGIAFDIGVFEGGQYAPESPAYREVAKLGKALGLAWGGDWESIVDEPHYEYNPRGYTLAQLRERKESGLPLV